MANRQHKQRFSAQSLVSNLQSQLDSDGELRASLAGDMADITAGSNDHLLELLGVTRDLEDDVNNLLCDLSLLQAALEVYSIAACSGTKGEIDVSDATAVFINLLPKSRDWDARLHQHFHRLHTMKRTIAH